MSKGDIFMQINKKGLIYILIIFLFFTITSSASGQKTDELIELTGIIADSNLEVDKWTVTIKEKIPTTKAKMVLDNLGATHNISVTETDELIKYKSVQIKELHNFTDIYKLKISKDKALLYYIIETIKSDV